MKSITFHDAVEQLSAGQGPSRVVAEACFEAILEGAWNPTQVASFSLALSLVGLSVPVLAGAASRMRAKMISVPVESHGLVDTCGTGGDGSGSLNLSTGAALLLASAGVRVAKHGNRAASSRSGSADVLEALGVALDLGPEEEAMVLKDTGIAFLFAQSHHPALKPIAPLRRELGVRTIWNCLGPLANPAGAKVQLVGAYSDELRPLMAGALRELGGEKAWVVRSDDGLDEVSPFAKTRVTELRHGELRELVVEPADFGLAQCPAGATEGGTVAENAYVLRRILAGEPHPATPAFVLNAAAALALAHDLPFREATSRIQNALSSGAGLEKLNALARRSQELSQTRKTV